jgi:hypothetical protein
MSKPAGLTNQKAMVIGGGIAGLSAAFYLAEHHFDVHVYEKEDSAGGNLGAAKLQLPEELQIKGSHQESAEVYPHLFADWYVNFWEIMEKIGRGKSNSAIWRRMEELKTLQRPRRPNDRYNPTYKTLRNNGDFSTALSNLLDGPLPLPDMFLAGFASLDIMSDRFAPDDPLSIASLGDYLNTRFYRSKYVDQYYRNLILNVWSIEPNSTSVYSCQRFFKFQFRDPTPSAWVLRSGNSYEDIIGPLVHYMEKHLKVTFHFNSTAVAAALNDRGDMLDTVLINEVQTDSQTNVEIIKLLNDSDSPAVAVFAVPPETLASLVQTPSPPSSTASSVGGDSLKETKIALGHNRHGIITDIKIDTGCAEERGNDPLHAIVKGIPALAATKALSAEPIPVIYILFRKEAPINNLIPSGCYIGLSGSQYSLTLVELRNEFESWNAHLLKENPSIGAVVALAASNYTELPMFKMPPERWSRDVNADDSSLERRKAEEISKQLILEEAKNYLPFEDNDIQFSFFRTNLNHRLYLNNVRSSGDPVQAMYRHGNSGAPIVTNLAFAGDFCSKNVVMATVEAAVESGLHAGQLLAGTSADKHRSHHSNHHHDRNIKPLVPNTYPQVLIETTKLLLTPYAVIAKSCSDLNELVEETIQANGSVKDTAVNVLPKVLSWYPQQASMVLGAYRDAFDTMNVISRSNMSSALRFMASFISRR